MANSWFRLWHDFAIDPKWRAIAHISERPLHMVQAIAVFLMSDASCNEMQRGATKCNALTVACATGCNEDDVASVLQAMQGIVLEGNVFINWEKRQPKREREEKQGSNALSSTERSRLRRERLRDATATENATPCNAQDTDKDKIRIDKNNTPLSPPSEKPKFESNTNGGGIRFEDAQQSTQEGQGMLLDDSPARVHREIVKNAQNRIKKPLKGEEALYTDEFNQFWNAYPTSDGRNKGGKELAAKKYHQALKHATHQQLMTGVENYGTFIASTGTFNANASSWLNQKRWNDDYTVTRNATPTARTWNQHQSRPSAWERSVASGFDAVQRYRAQATMEQELQGAVS